MTDWDTHMSRLSSAVVGAFGSGTDGTVALERVTPGAFDVATQTRGRASLSVTVKASRSARRVSSFSAGGGAGSHAAETDFLIDASELAATAWGTGEIKEGDRVLVGVGGAVVLPVVRVERQLDGAMWKITCRDSA